MQIATPKVSGRSHLFPSTPPVGKIGFVDAAEIPAGGEFINTALQGDFNGDHKQDVVTLVENNNGTFTYSISVVLSNGDGTFQAPVLTPVPGNDSSAQIVVGDVNGDGKADLIVAHQNGNAGYTSSSFDVLISNGDGTFTVGNNFPVTTNTLAGGVLADVNGDGKLDAVVVDQNNPANVWTLLGNGDGTFQTSTSVALSGGVGNNTIFADFNGDGLLDIVDNDYNTQQLTVYLATSATAYASGVSYTTSNSVYDSCSISAGDLSGDGKPEIVNANCADNTITVYVNNGDGSFQQGVYYNVAQTPSGSTISEIYPEAVTIADINGDGKADIISTNTNSADLTILLGNGDGTVQVPSVGYAVGGSPSSPAIVADFNGDGLSDIVVPDNLFSLAYLKGYGDGSFRSALNYYSPVNSGDQPFGVGIASGDFNGDGVPDFVLASYCSNCSGNYGVTVFLSRPDGSLQPGISYGSSSSLAFVTVGDFNKDGKLDIAADDYNNGVVQIFNGVGDGTFTVGSSFPTDTTNNTPAGLVAGDFNHDGYLDLAVENVGGQDVGILLNDGHGNFPTVATYALSTPYPFTGIATADLNGDGNLDLAISFQSGSVVAILLGNADGTFQAESDLAFGSPLGEVAIADLNGDGKPDLAVTVDANFQGSQGIMVALGNGDGTFGTPVLYATSLQPFNLGFGGPYPVAIQATDIDGDGNKDLVYVNGDYATLGVLFGVGDGTFYDPVEYPTGRGYYGLTVADVNGDGAPDVVTADDGFSGVTVLLNANGAATAANYTVSPAPGTATVTAGASATFTLTVTPTNHYNGTVTFSCGSLPALSTCAFSPASVTLNGAPVTVQLTIATAAASASLQSPAGITPHGEASILLAGLSTMGFFGMVLAGNLKKRNRWTGVILGILIQTMMFSLVACDGSSRAPSTQNQARTATTTTVSSSLGTAMVGQAVTFTGKVIASSGTATGTVIFMDGSTQLGTGTVSSGSATFQTSKLAAGTHNITASYSGDSNFNASTSSALNQTVDNPGTPAGTYTVTVTGTGTAGTNNGNTAAHPFNLTVTVQ